MSESQITIAPRVGWTSIDRRGRLNISAIRNQRDPDNAPVRVLVVAVPLAGARGIRVTLPAFGPTLVEEIDP